MCPVGLLRAALHVPYVDQHCSASWVSLGHICGKVMVRVLLQACQKPCLSWTRTEGAVVACSRASGRWLREVNAMSPLRTLQRSLESVLRALAKHLRSAVHDPPSVATVGAEAITAMYLVWQDMDVYGCT